MNRERERELEKEILRHRDLYYKGTPEISDLEFDQLEEDLRKVNPHNYVLSLVGNLVAYADKIKHSRKMLSLLKTYELEELESWIDAQEVVSTPKIDGVSCSLIYERGILKLAKTRGDGTFGEDIFPKVLWIDSIPKNISGEALIEVRGEIYCEQKNFFLLSEEMSSRKLDRPTSQRNIVAGLMGRKDRLEFGRYLGFFAFELIDENRPYYSEYEKLMTLKSFGFPTPEFKVHKGMEGTKEVLEKTREFMLKGDYQIDGVVFTYNQTFLHDELGETAHHPRYKIAFKFPAEVKKTKIEEINWSVSRNGILTPVARINPVELSGATITNVTLHNYGMVKQYNLKSGDVIEVIRSGEVIPKFLSLIEPFPGQFQIPSKCPDCSGPLNIEVIRLFCFNKNCPGRNKESILNFISKIGIEDLSSKRLDEMLAKKLILSIPDLYRIKIDDFLSLDKVQIKLATKLFQNIQKTKEVDLKIFLSAIGIRGGAIHKCEKVVNAGFDTIEKIKNLTVEDLKSIDSFAEKSSQDFLNSLKEKIDLIDQLLELGFKIHPPQKVKSKKGKNLFLEGKKFCITGALSVKRSIIEEKIKSRGGGIVSSVSKATNYLVTNEQDSTSTKFVKAKGLNIPVVSEEELELMLSQKKS